MNAITEDESKYTRLMAELRDKLHRTYDHIIRSGVPSTPALHVLTIEFDFDRSHPRAGLTGEEFNEFLLQLAANTLDLGQDLAYDVCDTLAALQDTDRAGPIPPFAMAAIDYPGTEAGWPRANEPPRFNAVVFVPESLEPDFKRFVGGEYEKFSHGGSSNFVPGYWVTRIRSLHCQELEYSVHGVEMAVAHVLKLCRTLPWKVFGDGASICFIRYPFNDRGELVSEPW